MAIVLSTGIIIPEPTDYISAGGVDEMALGFRGANDAIEARSLIGHTHEWDEIEDKPTSFPPSAHTHTIDEVDGLQPELDDIAAELATKMNVEATELPSGTNANTLVTPGVYYESRSSEAGENFPEPTAGVFTVTANPPREHVHQQFISFGSANPRYWYRSRYNGTWSVWKQLVTQDVLEAALADTAEEAADLAWEPEALGERNLNAITEPGTYTQDFSSAATLERNYPEGGTRAGRLFVQANTGSTQVNQQFITYDSNVYMTWFVRNYYLSWGEWVRVDLSGTDEGSGGSLEAEELGEADLDTIVDPGAYSQSFSAQATEARHYPRPVAGRLLVQANEARSQVTQQYVTFDSTSNVTYHLRNFYTTWGQWWSIPLGGSSGGGSEVFRGAVAEGTDINTLTAPGFYSVTSVAVAGTLVNWPTNRGGTLIVGGNPGTAVNSQDVIAHVSSTAAPERYVRTKLLSSTTSWSPWSSPEWIKGRVPIGTNVDTFRTLGAWMVVSASDTTGLPGSRQGVLEVMFITTAGISLQRFTERVANDEVKVWQRYSLTVGGWTGVAWDELGASSGGGTGSARVADVQVSDHGARVEVEASRRGGSIGTNGVPVFMWRFDHWLVDFRDKILPILRRYDLPATLNVNLDNLTNEQNGGGSITWLDVQAWNQYDGIEIANHGATHTNASSMEAIYHEVVEGRRGLEAAMPRTSVVTWQEHGSAYLVAGDLEGDTGLNLGREPRDFFESYAGRLILAEHAVVEGKFGSFYPPITGRPQIGQSHYSMDRQTSAESISTIEFAQEVGRGLTGYTHPGLMDQVNIDGSLYEATYNADGSVDFQGTDPEPTHYETEAAFRAAVGTGDNIIHMPTKDFEATCAWLAAERDAGRIMVMTAAGGGFADISHDRRENLLIWDAWAGAGWTRGGTGSDYRATSDASAAPMTQGMLLYTRFGWAMGATHEVLVYARADAATTLTLSLEEMGDTANWFSEKVHDVPGDGVLRPYRLNVTLPRDRSITSMTVRVGGPSLTIEGEPLLVAI